jgi:hypothetical protein
LIKKSFHMRKEYEDNFFVFFLTYSIYILCILDLYLKITEKN